MRNLASNLLGEWGSKFFSNFWMASSALASFVSVTSFLQREKTSVSCQCILEIRQSLDWTLNASLKPRICWRLGLCQNLTVLTRVFFRSSFPTILEPRTGYWRQGEHLFWGRETIKRYINARCLLMIVQRNEPQIWKRRVRCVQKISDHSVVAPYHASQCFVLSLLRPNSRHLFKESLHFPFFFRCQVECSWFFRH